MGELAERRGGKNAILRRFGLALGGLALGGLALGEENSEEARFAQTGEKKTVVALERLTTTLEEAFFELLWRCESPLLEERNEAEDELFIRFAEFEPVWQDRRFLTNGEIGAEARRRFALAEARYREKTVEECVESVQATFETFAFEAERDENGKNGEDGKDGERLVGGDAARGRVRLRWGEALRIVYWAPDWSAFERCDVDGSCWRPSGRFSAPELAPEFDATELTFETVWERVDEQGERDNQDALNGQNERNSKETQTAKNETNASVVGVVEGLVGADFRVWSLPLGPVALDNGKDRGNRESERRGEGGGAPENEGETSVEGGVGIPSVFQSGDAIASVGQTTVKGDGETTARVRLEFAETFDAFDSHRILFDKNDFVLTIEDEANAGAKTDGAEFAGRRWEPIRWRVRERSARGALFELDFPDDATLREAATQGRARLDCRVPRFFFWARIEVAGKE